MVSRKRTDLSRRLTQPLVIPGFMTLATLSDVRTLLDHLPAGHVEKAIWHHVADRLDDAARGASLVEVFALLRTVLAMEGKHTFCPFHMAFLLVGNRLKQAFVPAFKVILCAAKSAGAQACFACLFRLTASTDMRPFFGHYRLLPSTEYDIAWGSAATDSQDGQISTWDTTGLPVAGAGDLPEAQRHDRLAQHGGHRAVCHEQAQGWRQ